ncbi:MAG TPA: hypothetical protein PKD10_19805, partial [Paracoccaceae bacterium]|nr:hypothetical protein [Paracoccaceae bacterium]
AALRQPISGKRGSVMQTLLSRIFSVDNFHSLILRERARVLYTTVVVLMVLFTLFALVPGQLDGSSLFGSFGTDASATISILSAYGFGGLTLIANRRGSWLWSGIGILLTWFGVAIVIAWLIRGEDGGDFGHLVAILLALGAFITALGTFWVQLRAGLMRALPDFPGKRRLPPYDGPEALRSQE